MNATIKLLTLALAVTGAHWNARAASIPFGPPSGNTYTASWSGSQAIPDNNGSGLAFDLNFNDPNAVVITDLNVTFTISGGFNGDLFAYLAHGDSFTVLLNRLGRSDSNPDGSATSGFSTSSFTIGTPYSPDVHLASGNTGQLLTGNYAPDGRDLPPSSSGLAFDGATRNATFTTLLGDNPNGSWTLFFADVSPGSSGTISAVTVGVGAIPEPATVVLLFALGAIFGAVRRVRLLRRVAA